MRKVIQIQYNHIENGMIGLCNDGTLWELVWRDDINAHGWNQFPEIPQPAPEDMKPGSVIMEPLTGVSDGTFVDAKKFNDSFKERFHSNGTFEIPADDTHVTIQCGIRRKLISKTFEIDPRHRVYPQIWQSFRDWISDAEG